MRELEADIQALAQEFSGCRHILQALGDETRQHLILSMMQDGTVRGLPGRRHHGKDEPFPSGRFSSPSDLETGRIAEGAP